MVERGGVTVVIEQPFDWIGSVGIPVAAILVSAGIAIWLADAERRRGERRRRQEAVASTIGALTRFSRVTALGGDPGAVEQANSDTTSELNALAAILPTKDVPVIQYAVIVMAKARGTGTRQVVANAAVFVTTALESWARGTRTSKDFAANMPDEGDEIHWASDVDLSTWQPLIEGTLTAEEFLRPSRKR